MSRWQLQHGSDQDWHLPDHRFPRSKFSRAGNSLALTGGFPGIIGPTRPCRMDEHWIAAIRLCWIPNVVSGMNSTTNQRFTGCEAEKFDFILVRVPTPEPRCGVPPDYSTGPRRWTHNGRRLAQKGTDRLRQQGDCPVRKTTKF